MKKVFIAGALIVAMAASATAQDKSVSFGVRAGANLSTQRVNYDDMPSDANDDVGFGLGFHVGAVVDINFANYFYFTPGLLFTTKGYKSEGDDYKSTLNLYYLDVPLMVSFGYPVTDDFKLKASVGPVLGVGLFGSEKWEYTYNGQTEKGTNKDGIFSSGTNDEGEYTADYNRFNLGLGFGISGEFKQFSLGVNYNLGLLNVAHIEGDNDNNYSIKNHSITISLGYNF
ncbi:hypothetical protein FACS189452_07780 [Bacteroidia bacterium]|nr:hypothetical protein FACS189452_07780 [Bacteroidia bacterium]